MFTIPNIITLLNLLAGSIGIVLVIRGDAAGGAIWVWIAVFFDYLDGMIARLTNTHSDIGKDLDSLADVVSFGVLPGMVIFRMMEPIAPFEFAEYLAFLIPAFSALRLAKFNNDTRQADTFFGLPTPSNALFLTALPFLNFGFLDNYWILLGIELSFCYMLISELRMFAMKFKDLSFGRNKWKYLAVVLTLIMLVVFRVKAIPFVILGYILVSFTINIQGRRA